MLLNSTGKGPEPEAGGLPRDETASPNLAGKTVVLILGMHRSGTSLAAHAFAAAGLPLGQHLLLDPRPDNPDGYWEDADVIAAQEDLLKARFGGIEKVWGVEGLDDVDGPDCPAGARASALARLKGILANRLARSQLFVVKDPRTARLLPVWREVSRQTGVRLVSVLAIRHPGEVARSILKRDGLPVALGEIMWLRSVADVLTHTGAAPNHPLVATIVYDSWFSQQGNNRQAIERLASAVGVEAVRNWVTPVKEVHRHHQAAPVMFPVTNEIYHAIAGFGAGAMDEDTRRKLLHRIERLISCFGGWSALARAVAAGASLKQRPAILPLPAAFGDESPDVASWRSAGHVILQHGNEWCRPHQGGYLLHANQPGTPDAALEWQGVFNTRQAILRGQLAAGMASLKLTIEIDAGNGANVERKVCVMAPRQTLKLAAPLAAHHWHTIRLLVSAAPEARETYGAALTVFGMQID